MGRWLGEEREGGGLRLSGGKRCFSCLGIGEIGNEEDDDWFIEAKLLLCSV